MKKNIIELIQNGENQKVEFKASARDSKALSKSITSFANTNGGHLFIGISDNGKISGITQTPDKVQQILSAAAQSITPTPRVEIKSITISGKIIVYAYTQESSDQEYYTYKGAAYVRIGSTNQRLEGASQLDFLRHKQLLNFDEGVTSEASELDLDSATIQQYLIKRNQESYLNSHGITQFLTNTQLQKQYPKGLKNGAVLLFAKTPTHFFPQAEVKLVKFLDTEAVEIIDHQLLQNNLPNTIEETMGFIKKNLSKKIEIKDTIRDEVYEYPIPAIREIIVNAIVHRDYFSKDAIQMNIFKDRLEIISPGGVPRNLTKEIFGSISVQRNPVIYRFLRDMGYVEGLGTGIPRIKYALRKHGLKDPEFNWTDWFFKVVIYNEKNKKETTRPSQNLNERQKLAINYLKKHGTLKAVTYKEINGVSQATANSEIKKMVDLGYLEKIGEYRGAYYVTNNG